MKVCKIVGGIGISDGYVVSILNNHWYEKAFRNMCHIGLQITSKSIVCQRQRSLEIFWYAHDLIHIEYLKRQEQWKANIMPNYWISSSMIWRKNNSISPRYKCSSTKTMQFNKLNYELPSHSSHSPATISCFQTKEWLQRWKSSLE